MKEVICIRGQKEICLKYELMRRGRKPYFIVSWRPKESFHGDTTVNKPES